MVPLVILPMVPLVANGTIGLPMVPLAYQWYNWLINGTNCTIGGANGTIGITIGTNGITNGTVLENVDNIKYLGVTITNDLKWNTHISNICTKANRTLGFLRRTLFSCPQNVKEAAYKGMMRPILEYGSSVWDPHPDKLQKELEKVQNRAARFVTRNYDYETGSMTGILGQLKWESLKKRRKDNRLILLYKGLKGKAKIPTDDLIPKTRRGRNQHSLAFQIPSASKDVYMYSFFPRLSGTGMTSLNS